MMLRIVFLVSLLAGVAGESLQAQGWRHQPTSNGNARERKSGSGWFGFLRGNAGKDRRKPETSERRYSAETNHRREALSPQRDSQVWFGGWSERPAAREREPFAGEASIFSREAPDGGEKESSVLTAGDETVWTAPRAYPQDRASHSQRTRIRSAFHRQLYEVKGLPSRTVSMAEQVADEEETVEVPEATPIPGRPGFVKLDFDSRGLPVVDVRGLAPGAAVAIQDPLDSTRSIRFRIPEEWPDVTPENRDASP